MNKKGNIYMSIMVSLIIFVVGMIVVNFIAPEVTTTYSDLSCAAPPTDGTKILCLVVDSVLPYFFILVLSIIGGILTEKLLI
jgi:type II secretory pathway component PulF